MRIDKSVARAAIEALARHFSATLYERRGLAEACLRIGGKRIAVQVATMRSRASRHRGVISPRLRFDRVALGLIGRLQAALQGSVPGGMTVIATITAPIRVPAKTAGELAGRIQTLLASRAAMTRIVDTIHRNHVQIAIVRAGTHKTPKLIGFVHNPDSDPCVLFEVTRSLLACVGSEERNPARSAAERWLLIANRGGLLPMATYRSVCEQLRLPTVFERIFVVLPGGRIETLTARVPARAHRVPPRA